MPTFQKSLGVKSVEILYVLHHSSPNCPSYCLHISSWLSDDDAWRMHCMHRVNIASHRQIIRVGVRLVKVR